MLAKALKDLPREKGTLLQYADDILIASPTKEASELPSQQRIEGVQEKD